MECKFCNTENPEQAVFCRRCGKRLDGTAICPSCGGQISADDAFCIFCGADIKPAPALITDETAIAAAAGAADSPTVEHTSEKRAQTAKKVLNYVANGTAILTAVLALIFVFFIGTVLTSSISSTTTVSDYDINYFFHDGYKQLEKLKDLAEEFEFSEFYVDSNYAPLITGTIILATAIIAVLVLSIKAIVYSVQNVLGKSEQSGCPYAIEAFIALIFGAAMLLALTNCSSTIKDYELSVKFNSVTLTGIILCSIFSAVTLGCKIAERGRDLLKKDEVFKYVFAAIAVVLCAVMLGISSAPYFKIKAEGESISCSLIHVISILAAMGETEGSFNNINNSELLISVTAISFLALVVFAAFVMDCISKNTENMQDGGDRKTLSTHIALVVTSIVLLVLTIIIFSELKKAITELMEVDVDVDVTITFAVPIILVVFSILSLVENIVYRAIKRPAARPQNEV